MKAVRVSFSLFNTRYTLSLSLHRGEKDDCKGSAHRYIHFQHAVMVRVKGRDSHLQRSTATPVSLPMYVRAPFSPLPSPVISDGFTSLGCSGFICRAQSGRVIVLAPASIFTAFLQASEPSGAQRRPSSVQQFGTRLEIHKRPLSAAQKIQHMEQQPVEYDGQQLQDKVRPRPPTNTHSFDLAHKISLNKRTGDDRGAS